MTETTSVYDQYHNELKRRMDLIEFHALSLIEKTHEVRSIFHAKTLLKILNPGNNYDDAEWCFQRMTELERQYYDDFGRLKEI